MRRKDDLATMTFERKEKMLIARQQVKVEDYQPDFNNLIFSLCEEDCLSEDDWLASEWSSSAGPQIEVWVCRKTLQECETALASQFWSVMVSVMKLIIGLVMRLFRQPVNKIMGSIMWLLIGWSCYLSLGTAIGSVMGSVSTCHDVSVFHTEYILPGSRKRLKESFTPILTFW